MSASSLSKAEVRKILRSLLKGLVGTLAAIYILFAWLGIEDFYNRYSLFPPVLLDVERVLFFCLFVAWIAYLLGERIERDRDAIRLDDGSQQSARYVRVLVNRSGERVLYDGPATVKEAVEKVRGKGSWSKYAESEFRFSRRVSTTLSGPAPRAETNS